jgi:hypothetical protein
VGTAVVRPGRGRRDGQVRVAHEASDGESRGGLLVERIDWRPVAYSVPPTHAIVLLPVALEGLIIALKRAQESLADAGVTV